MYVVCTVLRRQCDYLLDIFLSLDLKSIVTLTYTYML